MGDIYHGFVLYLKFNSVSLLPLKMEANLLERTFPPFFSRLLLLEWINELTNMKPGDVKIHGQKSNTLQVCNLSRFRTECHIRKRAFPMYFFRFFALVAR